MLINAVVPIIFACLWRAFEGLVATLKLFLSQCKDIVVHEGLGEIDWLMLQPQTPCLLSTLQEFVYMLESWDRVRSENPFVTSCITCQG